eukprot:CAMPEP_0177728394 /NCGR_PEP_ID=MMETSP0484_2-20121128/20858_1 /TAXON_ID=354590 /ORGANISM="Rhodomonas lens, Strain RHODO" /LENGTH=75 /DNA_ID=CAMNT_0019241165 /DNA_START=7 /DNA_END=231 /DNA_ORIENTATION=-
MADSAGSFPELKELPAIEGCGIIMSTAFSKDGLLLAAGDNKGQLHVLIYKGSTKGWGVLYSTKAHEGDVVACIWA